MERDTRSNRKWIYSLVGIICVVIALVLVVFFLMKGNKEITDNDGDIAMTESITCSKEEIYPFFKFDNAKEKLTKINIVFNNNKLDTISLVAKLYYDSEEQIKQSSAENHIALNRNFYSDSMNTDSFDANFSYLENAMQMTLYAHAKDLNGVNAKYFLIESIGGYTMELLESNYRNQGFDCITKEKE